MLFSETADFKPIRIKRKVYFVECAFTVNVIAEGVLAIARFFASRDSLHRRSMLTEAEADLLEFMDLRVWTPLVDFRSKVHFV